MDRKNAWIVAGSVVVGFLLLGLAQVFAQRFPSDERTASVVGRYQVVRATADAVLLLDTVTGDLYMAAPRDIKPYDSRPRGGADRHGEKAGKDVKPDDRPFPFFKDQRPSDKPSDKKPLDRGDLKDGFNKDKDKETDAKPLDKKYEKDARKE
jgi:hypothetical protein